VSLARISQVGRTKIERYGRRSGRVTWFDSIQRLMAVESYDIVRGVWTILELVIAFCDLPSQPA
jgi:hypothetical protein